MEFGAAQFGVATLQIILIDIVLSGDNAVVIGLACRRLPAHQRRLGILWGMAGAIGLRVVLIFFAVALLAIPYLKVLGGALLMWIGVKLLRPEEEGDSDIRAGDTLWDAVKTIILADVVMSLDNVVAIAAAAHNSQLLVIFGLLVSVPIIMLGSQLVMTLMDRFPIIITGGGALLGWLAGGMAVSDIAISDWAQQVFPASHWVVPFAGACLVVALGKWLAARDETRRGVAMEDIAHEKPDSPDAGKGGHD
ncbi:MAG TPA: TerC family protein [Noviherbaspirillum sp.]|uniref:TerC family protein n=1 Tax=Noviherbaspirillum sp. TaxID=1926288 RepID=UPI002B496C03|nr:TerC family protein [Noviherbaspirillum sp.]HJV86621.1 TerC family protein [Noviherbaspirillum sp.]